MIVLDFAAERGLPVLQFQSRHASSRRLAEGQGDVRVHSLHLEAGGEIGRHPAGFDQIFFVLLGSAWAQSEGERAELRPGQGVYFARGEHHAKGSDAGAVTIVLQVSELRLEVNS